MSVVKKIIKKITQTKDKEKETKATARVKYTHIDRSTGILLREKDLDKKKPWLSPGGQASVEKLTEEELKEL